LQSTEIPEFTRIIETQDLKSKRPLTKLLFSVLLFIVLAVPSAIYYREREITSPPTSPSFAFTGFLDINSAENLITPQLETFNEYTVRGRVVNAQTLFEALGKFGLAKEDVESIIDTLKPKKADLDASLLKKSDFAYKVDGSGFVTTLAIALDDNQELLLKRNLHGKFTQKLRSIIPQSSERVSVGIIKSSFAAAATKSGIPYDLVDDLVDLFSDKIEFNKDFKAGDRFTIVYRQTENPKSDAPKYQLLAAAIEIKGNNLMKARFVGGDGKARFFDQKGSTQTEGFLRYPLKFSRISSTFTEARFHPVLKIKRPHNGVDFAAPTGTPVRAVGDGMIEFIGRRGGTGNMIKLKHSAKYATAYMHLNSFTVRLKNGSRVKKGDIIGTVGMTGLATGPHLHFSFYVDDLYVDPLSAKLPIIEEVDHKNMIPKDYLERVVNTLEHYQSVKIEEY